MDYTKIKDKDFIIQIAIEETAKEKNNGKITKSEIEKFQFNAEDEIEASLMKSQFLKLNQVDLILDEDNMDFEAWIEFLNQGYNSPDFEKFIEEKKLKILKSVLRDTIPLELLTHVWMLLSHGCTHLERKVNSQEFDIISLDLENPHLRTPLKNLKKSTENKIENLDYYKLLNEVKETSVDQIEKDIARTNWPYDCYLGKHEEGNKNVEISKSVQNKIKEIDFLLRGQCKRILSAFSVVSKETGYIQGMHAICASVVYNCFVSKWAFEKNKEVREKISMELEFIEEEMFYIFYGLMSYLKLTDAYKSGFKLMVEKIDKFGLVLKKELPKVHKKLTENDVKIKFLKNFLDAINGLFCLVLLDFVPPHDPSANLKEDNLTIYGYWV